MKNRLAMAKYLHRYLTETDFNADYNGEAYIEPWVSYTEDIERVDYNAHRTDYSKMPLTLEILEASHPSGSEPGFLLVVGSVKTASNTTSKPYYSVNGGEWTNEYLADSLISGLTAGDIIQFKGTGVTCLPSDSAPMFYANTSSDTFRYNVYGNIASLLYGDDFENADGSTLSGGCFKYIFQNSYGSSPVDASNLVIPFETLPDRACQSMFYSATTLTSAPAKLPARTVGASAYYSMFQYCTSLTAGPEIYAETFVGTGTCSYMFYGCTSLATASSELPATALTTQTYYCMFQGCSSLTTAPVIRATSLVNAYSGLMNMFNGCSNLNYVKAMFVDLGTSPFSTYGYGWLTGVAQNGTFVKNVNAEWTESDVIPAGWTIETANS